MYNNYLYHFGKLGMKWGHRNAKSAKSTTSKPKKKEESKPFDYAKTKSKLEAGSTAVNEAKKIESTVREASLKKQKQEIQRRDLTAISDSELKSLVTRMTMEKQYNTLQAEKIAVGKNHLKSILETTGTVLTVTTSAVALLAALDKMAGEKKKVA